MSMLHRRIATVLLLTLFVANGAMVQLLPNTAVQPVYVTTVAQQGQTMAQSTVDARVPYVDAHYGNADGIIDPWEYAFNYTDPVTGATVYLEHNGTVLFIGIKANTGGWVAIGWQDSPSAFATAGLDGSDLLFGYAPGDSTVTVQRVTPNDAVTVHYKLYFRNGTLVEEGDAPGDESGALQEQSLLQMYKDSIVGMRVGEVRHFIVPASKAYTNPSHDLYGEDLEYVITLNRIGENRDNPASGSHIVYSDQHGVCPYQHLPDDDQGRVLAANASEVVSGTTRITQLEYSIRMDSSDQDDITLLNGTDISYPMVLLVGASEDWTQFPMSHTDWSSPIMMTLLPNERPKVTVIQPEAGTAVQWIATIEVSVTDNTFVRTLTCRIDDDEWRTLKYDFKSGTWKLKVDVSDYGEGIHTLLFNATDASHVSAFKSAPLPIDRPYMPLMGMGLSVQRVLKTLKYHLTLVTDTFNVTNEASVPVESIDVYLPAVWSSKLLWVKAKDTEGNRLRIVGLDEESGLRHWKVFLFEPVSLGESYQFQLSMYFHSLHSITNREDYLYSISFLKYPVVPYVLNTASLTVDLRSGEDFRGGNPAFRAYDIAPMTVEDLTFTIKSYTPLIHARRTTRVTVDPWGWMTYEETVFLDNVGPARENIFTFTLPSYWYGVKVYDDVGVLGASQHSIYEKTPESDVYTLKPWNDTVSLSINLRDDRFGKDAFWPGYKYTFHVSYHIQLAAHQVGSPLTGAKVEIPMATLSEVLVLEHVVEVVTPMSVTVSNITAGSRTLYGLFGTVYRFVNYNTTKYNPPEIALSYSLTAGVLARPMLFASIIAILAAVYVSLRKAEFAVAGGESEEAAARLEATRVGAPPDILRRFATLYSRKTALTLDLEKLRAARARGKVKAREYRMREHQMTEELEKIDSELPAVRDELISYGPRYRTMIGQLELESERIEGAKAGLAQLKKRKKRISTGAYERMREDYLKRIRKATAAIDRIIMSLQEEAGD